MGNWIRREVEARDKKIDGAAVNEVIHRAGPPVLNALAHGERHADFEELVETPVQLLSTSPEREDTILMRDPFAD